MTAQHDPQPNLTRRALAASLGLLPAMPLLAGTPAPQGPTGPGALTTGVFRHSGLLLTDNDAARIRAHIKAGQQPWTDWWNKLRADPSARLGVQPSPREGAYRADHGADRLYGDIWRAWSLALCWKLSDPQDSRYADDAVATLDAWGRTLKEVGTVPPGSTSHDDHTYILLAGIQGHQLAQIGEIMRSYPGWSQESQTQFKAMLLNVFAKISSGWLTDMTDKGWGLWSHANWHLASMVGTMAIGVFCDRHDLYRQACDYYAANNRGERKMFGNGSIVHGVYFMHPGHLGQWQESGRDQGHSTLGMSLGGDFLEIAWNQGDDLYGLYNNRFLAAAEYVARSNLLDENGKTYALPFSPQDDASRPHANIWTQVNQSFQHGRNAWEPIYNHYVNRMGLAAPNVARMVPLCEPKFGGSTDDVWWPTLIHRRPSYSGPMKPASGLTANVRDGKAVLSWWGSVGAGSYVVSRGGGANGPFSPLATVSASELLTFTDTPPNGVWFYQVTAVSGAGVRAGSNVARAAVPGEPRFSMPLNGRNNTDIYAAQRSPSGEWSVGAGRLLNGATWGEGRLMNDKAIAFDGLASAEGNTAGVKLPAGIFSELDDFTVSLWAYANALRWDSALFYAGHDGFSGMAISPQAGRGGMRFAIFGAGGDDCQSVETSSAMPTRRWVHVAFTLRGTTGRLYVDGMEAGSSDSIFLSPRQVGDQLAFLGRNWGHPSFNGRIQDFRVYAGALSASEVAALAK
ncbi:LamG-like jellyroll fold domain-containing protein [Ideonella sp. YS5]|uniref:LamG-like jellyroll fold domain-containing protein n=1 Tax=Ideonella sp. YS5 TaxID=3453714 RepID=UPI003EEC7285